MEQYNGLNELLNLQPEENKYALWGVEFNPFPRSGTSNINGSDSVNRSLEPLDKSVLQEINRFIANALVPNRIDSDDQFMTATVAGDYGSGKTQLLMYVKAQLNVIKDSHKFLKPYSIYIDNPGGSVLEFIGRIIDKVGEENLRKYVWNHIVKEIISDEGIKTQLKPYISYNYSLFSENQDACDPYSETNTTSYKKFLDVFVKYMQPQKRKKFDEIFSGILRQILNKDAKDPTVGYYFYEFISSDYGVNKTWEALTSGNLKQVAGKEADVIKYIVTLLKREGFTHVFILVDEFEDLTEGRLSKVQLDNYVHNLRTLLDQQREWILLFAMNPLALERLRKVSPPLADRISVRLMSIPNLSTEEIARVFNRYLTLAGYEGDVPFTIEAMDYMRETCDGNIRRILKAAFALFEIAADVKVKILDRTFVENNMPSF